MLLRSVHLVYADEFYRGSLPIAKYQVQQHRT